MNETVGIKGNMKLQIYKTEQGYVAVSEKVKPGDFVVIFPLMEIIQVNQSNCIMYDFKIIATDTSFKIEGVAQFELEKDNSEILYKLVNIDDIKNRIKIEPFDSSEIIGYKNGQFFVGNYYCKYGNHIVKSDESSMHHITHFLAQTKGCYSEEDLRNAYGQGNNDGSNNLWKEESFIQFTKQSKKLVAIDVEIDKYSNGLLIVKEYIYE